MNLRYRSRLAVMMKLCRPLIWLQTARRECAPRLLLRFPRPVHRHRELRDVRSFCRADLADALLADLVDSQNRVHGKLSTFDAFELGFDALFGRVHQHCAALAEDKFFNFDEAPKRTLAHLLGIDLI